MKYKFLIFMKSQFSVANANLPRERWDRFIVSEFREEERQSAVEFTNKLIEGHYIGIINFNSSDYIQITGFGYEMVKKNILEV